MTTTADAEVLRSALSTQHSALVLTQRLPNTLCSRIISTISNNSARLGPLECGYS